MCGAHYNIERRRALAAGKWEARHPSWRPVTKQITAGALAQHLVNAESRLRKIADNMKAAADYFQHLREWILRGKFRPEPED